LGPLRWSERRQGVVSGAARTRHQKSPRALAAELRGRVRQRQYIGASYTSAALLRKREKPPDGPPAMMRWTAGTAGAVKNQRVRSARGRATTQTHVRLAWGAWGESRLTRCR
jgi:hypothetical protein